MPLLYMYGKEAHQRWGRNQFLAVCTAAAVTTGLVNHVATLGLMLVSDSVRAAMRLRRRQALAHKT